MKSTDYKPCNYAINNGNTINVYFETTSGVTADHSGHTQCKAWTVFANPNIGIMRLNRIRGMDVCVRLFSVCVVLCVGSGLATGWSLVQGVLPTVYVLRNWKSDQGPQGL
jgi:hypothetical protein